MYPPTAEPWYDNAEALSPRASRFFDDLLAPDANRVSGKNAAPHNKQTQEPSTRPRPASVLTPFPQLVASDPVPEDADTARSRYPEQLNPAAQKESFFRKHYRRLKAIHDNGPPGEAQMFLAGIKSYLKDKNAASNVTEMCSPRQKDGASPRPFPASAVESLRQPPLVQSILDIGKPQTRKDSAISYGNISCTSREVPVKIRRTVLEMDTNKPLPLSPPHGALLKQRPMSKKGRVMEVNKPLPLTPLDYSSSTNSPSEKAPDESPVDASWPSVHARTTQKVDPKPSVHQLVTTQEDVQNRSQGTEKEIQRTWLDDFTDTSNPYLAPAGKSNPSKDDRAHEALKSKISNPIPVPRTLSQHSPDSPPPSGATSEKANGTQKPPSPPTWLDRLAHPTLPALPTIYKPRRRQESDESFVCLGLGENNVYAQIVMGGAALSADDTPNEALIPDPLFTGGRNDGTGKKTGRWV